MITEDYVSFETAKLLKEKGFDNVCHAFYDKDGIFINLLKFVGNCNFKGVNMEKITFAPTLQMAMKWLREVHHLQICITSYSYAWIKYIHGWQFVIKKLIFTEDIGWNWDDGFDAITDRKISDDIAHETYEEACEAAIKHCLENLI